MPSDAIVQQCFTNIAIRAVLATFSTFRAHNSEIVGIRTLTMITTRRAEQLNLCSRQERKDQKARRALVGQISGQHWLSMSTRNARNFWFLGSSLGFRLFLAFGYVQYSAYFGPNGGDGSGHCSAPLLC